MQFVLYCSPIQTVCIYTVFRLDVYPVSRVSATNKQTMAAMQEKAGCVKWLAETKSEAEVQRHHRWQYGKEPPSKLTIQE